MFAFGRYYAELVRSRPSIAEAYSFDALHEDWKLLLGIKLALHVVGWTERQRPKDLIVQSEGYERAARERDLYKGEKLKPDAGRIAQTVGHGR